MINIELGHYLALGGVIFLLGVVGIFLNRKKIETLVTIHVHQKDVSRHLKNLYTQGLLKLGKDDFEWLQQARFYWEPKGADDCTDDGAMNIYVADWLATYQYEFLGAKERLVITPLTDRCYITLGQALGMFFGGAPRDTTHSDTLNYRYHVVYDL